MSTWKQEANTSLSIQCRKSCSLGTTWVTKSKVANLLGFLGHLAKNLPLSVSWAWFDFHVLFLWDKSKWDTVEGEWGPISLCKRSASLCSHGCCFSCQSKGFGWKSSSGSLCVKIGLPWLQCWPSMGLWFYLCMWQTYIHLKGNQQDMHTDTRLLGCPNLPVLRGVENFALLTGEELKLLQGRKGRN